MTARVACLFGLFLLALALLMTYPLALDLSGTVLGPPGDNFEYVYKLWWFKHALLDRNISPFFVPEVFHPFGYDIALSETTLSHTIVGLPLTAAIGETAAYNVLILWSFVLSGVAAFLLARTLTRSTPAALVAGLIFAFLPYRVSHVGAGHLPLLATGWLPLVLLYVERVLHRPRLRDGALAGLFFALLALGSWYYGYIGGLTVGVYVLARGRPWRAVLLRADVWKAAVVGASVAVVIMAPAALPMLSLAQRGEMARSTLSLQYVDQWSASVVDFVLPSIMHPLWGRGLVDLYSQNVHENLIWLGFLPLLLAIYAVVRGRRAPGFLAVALMAFVLALGPTVHWAGEPVYVPVPQPVEDVFLRAMYAITGKYALNPASYGSLHLPGHIVLPLPTLGLYLFLPFFSAMRVWARFGLVVGLAVSMLAACGLADLIRRRMWGWGAARQSLAAVLVGAWIIFEFWTAPHAFGVTDIGAQPVDIWLRDQPGDFAVLLLPPEKAWHGPLLYAARQHGKSIAYGYGTYMPPAYRAWQRRVADFPDSDSLRAIKEAGIRYVVVGLRSYGAREQEMRLALDANERLRLVYTVDELPIFRSDRLIALVKPSAAVPPTETINGTRYAYLVDEVAVYEILD